MIACTMPVQPGDTRYVYGKDCTWHAPIALAGKSLMNIDVTSFGDDEPRFETLEVPACPRCGGRLREVRCEALWWDSVHASDREFRRFEAVMRWGQGRCFPDDDTLLDAYRQAMEGQE